MSICSDSSLCPCDFEYNIYFLWAPGRLRREARKSFCDLFQEKELEEITETFLLVYFL
jgi:hypothetical protein